MVRCLHISPPTVQFFPFHGLSFSASIHTYFHLNTYIQQLEARIHIWERALGQCLDYIKNFTFSTTKLPVNKRANETGRRFSKEEILTTTATLKSVQRSQPAEKCTSELYSFLCPADFLPWEYRSLSGDSLGLLFSMRFYLSPCFGTQEPLAPQTQMLSVCNRRF